MGDKRQKMKATPRRSTPRADARQSFSSRSSQRAGSLKSSSRLGMSHTSAHPAEKKGILSAITSKFAGSKKPAVQDLRHERRSVTQRDRMFKDQRSKLKRIGIAAAVLAGLAIACVLTLLVLSTTPIFTIENITATSTTHISEDTILKLAKIGSNTTLLNLDEKKVTENLRRNPWIESVHFDRQFPDSLHISVTERNIQSLVLMSSGNVAWYLGASGAWIEPTNLEIQKNASLQEAALAKAKEMDCLLITDVPATVSPVAGAQATDSVLKAVKKYVDGFSPDFEKEIVNYMAPNPQGIAITLANGVEVALGEPDNIGTKEEIIKGLLKKFPGQITYINVRVISKPTYRKVGINEVPEATEKDQNAAAK